MPPLDRGTTWCFSVAGAPHSKHSAMSLGDDERARAGDGEGHREGGDDDEAHSAPPFMVVTVIVVLLAVLLAAAFLQEAGPLIREDWREWRVMRALGLKRRRYRPVSPLTTRGPRRPSWTRSPRAFRSQRRARP